MIKYRILQFIQYLGISVRQFETNCGLSNGMINNIGENVRKTSLDKISKYYPSLNINWIKTGEGHMLRESNAIGIVAEPEAVYGNYHVVDRQDRLLTTIEMLTETNERNSRSLEIMAKTVDRNSSVMERLVNFLTKSGVEIPDGLKNNRES